MRAPVVEAVTVCINYGDFLGQVAPYNLAVLDNWLIVTSPEDEETREVCRKFGIKTLLTKDHKRNPEDFNKGRIIERALQHLSADSWRLHLDGDIVLPGTFRRALAVADLNHEKIYGCDRVMVKNWDDWQKLKSSGWFSQDYHNRVNFPHGYQVGTRWANNHSGYVPIGFFQLWSGKTDQWKGVRIKEYSSDHNNACRTDVQFGLQFDRRDRELLPERLSGLVHL
jgi:hypothetical protein